MFVFVFVFGFVGVAGVGRGWAVGSKADVWSASSDSDCEDVVAYAKMDPFVAKTLVRC